MQKGFYLSYASLSFDGHTDFSRQEAEHFINAHYQGLKGGARDYMIQVGPNNWLLSGLSPLATRAVVSMCKGMRLTPNRLDITMDIEQGEFLKLKANSTPYADMVEKTTAWFNRHRPNVAKEENAQMFGMARTVYGSRTSRWQLSIADHVLGGRPGLSVTFQLRQDRCKSGWEWLAGLPTDKDSDFEEACSELFAACTNTLLAKDYFGVGNSQLPFLASERKTEEKRDWYATLSAFANKIIKQAEDDNSPIPARKSLDFLQREIENRLLYRSKGATIEVD
jgi:hypothetical protein